MSSFFAAHSAKKRKWADGPSPSQKKQATSSFNPAREPRNLAPKRKARDESISGSEEDDGEPEGESGGTGHLKSLETSSDEGEDETAAEKRLRLAERYLEHVRGEVAAGDDDPNAFDAEEIDRNLIAQRLQEDVAESKGRMYRALADEMDWGGASHAWGSYHGQSLTGIATEGNYMYTVGKGVELVKWKLQKRSDDQWPRNALSKGEKKRGERQAENAAPKPRVPPKKRPEQVKFIRGDKFKAKDSSYKGHTDNILCVAASQDGKFVATGGRDWKIIVWDAESLVALQVFTHHRDSVTALVFRRGTNQLYSASMDRTVKVWSLDEMAYVETLFGHQDHVVDITALTQERCISVGARDRTARLWKVAEETQLVFRGGGGEKKAKSSSNLTAFEGSIDRVAMIDEEIFVTGSDNGSLSLWSIHKKKPVFTLNHAHGMDSALKPGESAGSTARSELSLRPQPRSVTALATIPYSDVILTGSWDGQLRAWKVSGDKKKIERMGTLGVADQINIDAATNAKLDIFGPGLDHDEGAQPIVRGIINDISILERGDRAAAGICVVVAVGKEHRFGRWKTLPGRNGAVVLEVSRK